MATKSKSAKAKKSRVKVRDIKLKKDVKGGGGTIKRVD